MYAGEIKTNFKIESMDYNQHAPVVIGEIVVLFSLEEKSM